MKLYPLFILLALGSPAALASELSAASLDWMAGHWCGSTGARQFEEVWLPAAGGQSFGVGRTLVGDKVVSFEFMRVSESDGTLVFMAQPEGRPPVTFRLAKSGENWVRFENPEHDFPVSVEYRRDGDAMVAEIAGPGRNGAERRITFAFSACGRS